MEVVYSIMNEERSKRCLLPLIFTVNCLKGILWIFSLPIVVWLGIFYFTAMQWNSTENNGRILQVNDFPMFCQLSLFIQKFVKYLFEACAKKDFNFFISYS